MAGSVNTHPHSVQVSSTTAMVGCALLVILHKTEHQVDDATDPLSVSVRANDLAESQLPHTPPVLLSLNAVHISAAGSWPWMSACEKRKSRPTHGLSSSSVCRSSQQLARTPSLSKSPVQACRESPAISAYYQTLTRPTHALLSNPPATSFATSFVSSPLNFSFSAPSSLSLAVRTPSALSIALRWLRLLLSSSLIIFSCAPAEGTDVGRLHDIFAASKARSNPTDFRSDKPVPVASTNPYLTFHLVVNALQILRSCRLSVRDLLL